MSVAQWFRVSMGCPFSWFESRATNRCLVCSAYKFASTGVHGCGL